MSDQGIQIQEIVKILKRNFKVIFFTTFLVTAATIATAYMIPKKFKSKAVLSIESSYFQVPLVNNLISQTRDPQELKAQRIALIRLALNDQFLDQLGTKYEMFTHPLDHRLHTLERELFLQKIETFALGATSFQIGATSDTAEKAYNITREALDQIIGTLINERLKKLEITRNALEENLQGLQATVSGVRGGQSLQRELDKVEKSLESMRQQFTENHPKVRMLKRRAEALKKQLENFQQTKPKGVDVSQEFLDPSSKKTKDELYNDLLKKLNNLKLVMDMEKDPSNVNYLSIIEQPTIPSTPFFPKKMIFAVAGLVAGLFLSILIVLIIEYRRGTFLSPMHASSTLDVPFLGVVPTLIDPDRTKMLQYQTQELPEPTKLAKED